MKSSNSCREWGLLLASLFLTGAAFALDPHRAMTQYLRDRWGTERGFPKGPVYAISQTSDGYLWIGAASGLFRFDGFTFRQIKEVSGGVLELLAAPDGSLWVRLQDLTLLHYRNGIFDLHASASAMSRTGRGEILIAEPQAGVEIFRDGAFHQFASTQGLSRTPLTALAQTPNGDLWLGTRDAGLFRSSTGNIVPALKINCLLANPDSTLWIGTDEGVVLWNGAAITTTGIPESFRHLQVLSMMRDRDANIWIATDSGGLLRLNSQGVARLDEADALTAAFEDREGNLWLGSASGLERLSDSAFVTYSTPEGLPTDGNNPVYVDSDNKLWFPPVAGGLWWVKDGQHGHSAALGLDKDVIYSIDGANGELWLGRQRGGLTRLRSDSSKTYTQADGLAQNSVYSVYRSRDGSIWAGTLSGGVSKFAHDGFTNYSVADGLASNTVFSILESPDGTMWFGTADGLSALSNGHWTAYSARDGLPGPGINCLLLDSAGVLWVGTTAGLAMRDSGPRFRVPAGVPSAMQEQILGIAEDRFGWLWMATSTHVLRVRRDKLLSGEVTGADVREFGLADGLRGVEGVKRYRSVISDPAGRIWFSLNRGISSVHPARLDRASAPVLVHLLGISVDNDKVELSPPLHIPGGGKRITFAFIGLSLSAPDRVRYRYRLEGIDHGWSEPSASREATYTNLGPHLYRFHVQAANEEGVWSSDDAAIYLRVDSLYWQTWWFQSLALLAFGLAGAAIYRLRLRQLTARLTLGFDERLAERTRIARDLHDTLLQGLHGLMFRFQAANNLLPARPADAKKILESALEGATEAITEARDAVHDLRQSAAPSADLAATLTALAEELAAHQAATSPDEPSAAFAVDTEGAARDLHPILRDEIYRIAGEALRNAFRHAHARRIELEIQYDDRQLRVRIRDNGVGIAPSVLGLEGRAGHWGLPGMHERARIIGGDVDIWSQPGAGTEIELRIPARLVYQTHRGRKKIGVRP